MRRLISEGRASARPRIHPDATARFGRAEARPSEVNPRAIEVHIDELILHGFAPRDRWQIGDMLEHELRGLLAARGIPATWFSSPERIDAGRIRTMSLNKPATVGAEIASAVYRNQVSELTNKQRR